MAPGERDIIPTRRMSDTELKRVLEKLNASILGKMYEEAPKISRLPNGDSIANLEDFGVGFKVTHTPLYRRLRIGRERKGWKDFFWGRNMDDFTRMNVTVSQSHQPYTDKNNVNRDYPRIVETTRNIEKNKTQIAQQAIIAGDELSILRAENRELKRDVEDMRQALINNPPRDYRDDDAEDSEDLKDDDHEGDRNGKKRRKY